jgi:hypothetical protein
MVEGDDTNGGTAEMENPAAMAITGEAPNAIHDGGKRSENRKAKRGAQHDGLVREKRFLPATRRTIERGAQP